MQGPKSDARPVLARGPLDLQKLNENYVCIVRLVHLHQPGVIQQVTLRPDKVHDGYIRLGETPEDEAIGWQCPENIEVLSVLGIASLKAGGNEKNPADWSCRPLLVEVSEDEAYAMACP